jgi:hypothetical protein
MIKIYTKPCIYIYIYMLYGSETLCLILREESGLKVSESRVPRSMSGPKSSGTVQHIFRQWIEKITAKVGGER